MLQEEIERAQKEQENMEKSSQESSSSDSSSSDSEKSSFGCASEKASPSPKRLKRKSAGPKPIDKPKTPITVTQGKDNAGEWINLKVWLWKQ